MLYLFDGTENGFLTAFIHAYRDENAVVSARELQIPIGETPVYVQTDEHLAQKARARFCELDKKCLKELALLLRSGENDCAQTAFAYLRSIARAGRATRRNLANVDVFKAVQTLRRIGLEIHRFHGFIRFIQTASGALYAPFSPDHDICDLLLPHFKARFPEYPFVLHDVKRKKAAVYDGKNVFVAPLADASIVVDGDENAWQALFKRYYQAVNIPSRERLKQMRGYLPKRYEIFMPEKR